MGSRKWETTTLARKRGPTTILSYFENDLVLGYRSKEKPFLGDDCSTDEIKISLGENTRECIISYTHNNEVEKWSS